MRPSAASSSRAGPAAAGNDKVVRAAATANAVNRADMKPQRTVGNASTWAYLRLQHFGCHSHRARMHGRRLAWPSALETPTRGKPAGDVRGPAWNVRGGGKLAVRG